MRYIACISLVLVAGILTGALPEHESEIAQAREAALLRPRDFPNLPSGIRSDLESRSCRIPQSYIGPRPQNVISGKFRHPGQTDWAVLCLKDNRSSILVYWGGAVTKVEEIEPHTNPSFHFERTQSGELLAGFSRALAAVGEDYIVYFYETYREGPEPPPIDHQGINDAIVEKASSILYWHEGRWLHLAGAD